MTFDLLLRGDTKFANLRTLCDENNIEFLNMTEQSEMGLIAARFTRGQTSADIKTPEANYFADLEETERRLIVAVSSIFGLNCKKEVPLPERRSHHAYSKRSRQK